MSEADRVNLAYVEETGGYASSPASGWAYLRFTSESLEGAPRTVESQQIRADRQVADVPLVGLDVAGSFDFEMSAASQEDFLEAAMCDTWSSSPDGSLIVSTNERSFSLEKQFTDLTNEYFIFRGMRVGTLELNFRYGEIVTGTVSMAGAEAVSADATGAGTPTAVNTNNVMEAATGISLIKVDGATTALNFREITLSIDNQLRPVEAIGNIAPVDQNYGRSRITGSFSTYLADMDLYDKVRNNTALELEWTVTKAPKSYNFRMPNVKLTGGSPSAGGPNSDIMPDYPFQALYDASAGSQLVITRTSV